jgi:prepilin-type processing-associated H-X9-DG protein
LLVVIGVIGVLMALAVPVLNGTLASGRQANEMAAARQLMLGYTAYATDYREALLPGYLQGLPARNEAGDRITGEAAARYPWRLAAYLNYNFRGLYKNTHERVLEEMEQGDPTYVASLAPSLGINGQWVGGDERELSFNATAERTYGRFCVKHLPEVRRGDHLLVFVSARGIDPLDPEPDSAVVIEGYFKVLSPRFRRGDDRWSEVFDDREAPEEFGYVSPRHNDGAVTAFIDGHTELLAEAQLRDMRYWANNATTADYGVEPQ